jgi:hypothetical protein
MRILFMDDNNNKNQPGQTASDYQKILDEYAASIKPETTPNTAAPEEVTTVKLDEVKDTANEKAFLKDINNPQLESPVHPSLAANLEADDDYSQMPSNEPEKIPLINPPKNDFVPPTPPTPVQEPVKTPEQIIKELEAFQKPSKEVTIPNNLNSVDSTIKTDEEVKTEIDSFTIPKEQLPNRKSDEDILKLLSQ